ncbi:uncharacterized protein LOC122577372 [Bombus pyrosoma]|uniref:uncharacterized protein LOC122577372 n=1 Tax=Bombus pyrosoma TaxID=396416 RepID=UPI001CB929B9|nr:uncharacterized protein LOC122577372 [Bombus pyrosoma]
MASPSESILNTPNSTVNSTLQVRPVITVEESITIIRELIQSFMLDSTPESKNIWLPYFNPEIAGADPAVWCAVANRLMEEHPLQDGALYSVLSRALEGSAGQWLKKIMVDELDITWPRFKELFTMRFGGNETATWALMKIMREQPLKGENIWSFGLRLRCMLKTRWQNLTIPEIINACVLARLTSEDERIERIALSKCIKTEDEFQNEMKEFSYSWPVPSSNTSSASPEVKRHNRSRSRIKCFYCGIAGHTISVCHKRINIKKQNKMRRRKGNQLDESCYFKCHGENHAVSNCPLFRKREDNSNNERRVDSRVMEAGTLSHIDTTEDL